MHGFDTIDRIDKQATAILRPRAAQTAHISRRRNLSSQGDLYPSVNKPLPPAAKRRVIFPPVKGGKPAQAGDGGFTPREGGRRVAAGGYSAYMRSSIIVIISASGGLPGRQAAAQAARISQAQLMG